MKAVAVCVLLCVGAGLALRCVEMDCRPMHVDEAVQAEKFSVLQSEGTYAYDPDEYHGPTLAYASLVPCAVLGWPDYSRSSEAQFRSVPVFFGIALILLLYLVRDGLGRGGAFCAAGLTALSPAMVFYSRYYIHEMLLVFFSFGALAAGWRYCQSRNKKWAVAAGVCIGLMHATKETCVISFGAMILALSVPLLWNAVRSGGRPVLPERTEVRAALLGAVAACAVSVIFFTSFFTHAAGPLDSIRTYAAYFERAEKTDVHRHPWWFYFERLVYFQRERGPVWSEGFVFALAALGAGTGFSTGRSAAIGAQSKFLRFVTVYALALAAVYCAIPYKTPWCMLSFFHALILLAGCGAAALLTAIRCPLPKTIAVLLLAAFTAHLGWQAHRASFVFPADPCNPYVYAQTSPDFLKLIRRIEEVAGAHPNPPDVLIKVITPEHWPLPWYLRKFRHVGYWNEPPEDSDAPMIVSSPELAASLAPRLRKKYSIEFFGLRPGVLVVLHVQTGPVSDPAR